MCVKSYTGASRSADSNSLAAKLRGIQKLIDHYWQWETGLGLPVGIVTCLNEDMIQHFLESSTTLAKLIFEMVTLRTLLQTLITQVFHPNTITQNYQRQ